MTLDLFFLYLFIVGWITEIFSLIDIGRYSLPLTYFAVLPLCAAFRCSSALLLMPVIASTVFAALVGLFQGADVTAILSQLALQALAIAFASGVAALNWRPLMNQFSHAMTFAAVPVVLYGGYQMIARTLHLPYAFLPITNKQFHAVGGLQLGWEQTDCTRASSFFSEPSAFGYFCLWVFALGLSTQKGKLRFVGLVLACFGILFSQSLSAALGVGVLLLAYLFSGGFRVRVLCQFAAVMVGSTGIAIAIIVPFAPEAYSRFSVRIHEALSLDERADSDRMDRLPANWQVFMDSPVCGHGLSSLTVTPTGNLETTTVTYAMLLMERGYVGAGLFLLPWLLVAVRAWTMPATDDLKTAATLLTTLSIYEFFVTSVAYDPPLWLSLGITASIVLRIDPISASGSMELSRLALRSRSAVSGHFNHNS